MLASMQRSGASAPFFSWLLDILAGTSSYECSCCRRAIPRVPGEIKVEKATVDKNSLAAGRCGVRSIPTLLLFKVGQVIDKIIGDVPQKSLEDLNKRAL